MLATTELFYLINGPIYWKRVILVLIHLFYSCSEKISRLKDFEKLIFIEKHLITFFYLPYIQIQGKDHHSGRRYDP